ncbi:MAG: SpoIIE family protein phosphatase [Anaerolineae bacterium]|nr:SpoIIE family protein phosphatase [Anaerolineae bacterium]
MKISHTLRTFFKSLLHPQSFQRKLILFNLAVVVFTTIVLFLFLMNNFQTITEFSLAQNTTSMEQTVEDYLTKYAQEKATSTWLQLKAAQDNLAILGKTAQKIVDNYDEIRANPAIFELSLFQTPLQEERGALSSGTGAEFDALIPPPITTDPRARELLEASALLNLNLDAIYQANINNAFVYFVGNPDTPVTRAYPNIHLVEVLQDGLNLLFWKDYFAPNVTGWVQWYTDPDLQARVPDPITVEAPYADAAGQGMMVTMFYPLWDKEQNTFAGAVCADVTLDKIIENVLSIQVARTGFAFLMNGKGEIIAMPETGYKLFEVNLVETKQGGLSYYTGALTGSTNPAIQEMATTLLAQPEGVLKLDLGQDAQSQINKHLVAYAGLPSLSDNTYQEDRWRIVIVVPEVEIFEALNTTHAAITAKSMNISMVSLVLVVLFLAGVAFVSVRVSNNVTRDLRALAQAAEQISAKNYAVEIKLKSQDEIGQLGHVFETMAREIRDYTVNLEAKVAERTADLKRANDDIVRLNEQLRGENLRLGAELDVARQLQLMVLPPDKEIKAIHDLDIACFMRPADEVGGDYYDVLQVGDSVYLGIGDVTGHGLPAGVIMLMAQTSFLTLSQSGEQDMQRILSVLNQVLYKNIVRIREDKNMTLAVLQYHNHGFNIVGQHESVLICRRDGRIELIDTLDLGFPVGLEEDIESFIAARHIHLESDDVMVLYTDGVTEAENERHIMFGMEGLIACLRRYYQMDAQEIVSHIVTDVYAFIGESRIYDDISLLVIKQK